MTASSRAIPLLLALAGGVCSTSAQALAACSHDRLPVDGRMVDTTLCTGVATTVEGTKRLPLQAHFAIGGTGLDRALVLRFPALTPTPRAVEDVDLTPLGIPRTLHLSLRPRDEGIDIVHALLLPGPVVIR